MTPSPMTPPIGDVPTPAGTPALSDPSGRSLEQAVLRMGLAPTPEQRRARTAERRATGALTSYVIAARRAGRRGSGGLREAR